METDHRVKSAIGSSFTFRVVFVAAIGILVTIGAITKGDLLAAVIVALIAAGTLWCYFDTWYELRETSLHIHFGPLRRTIKYEDIRNAGIPYAYLNSRLMGLSHECLEINLRRGLIRTVCISPEKLMVFYDELIERCHALDET